MRKHRIASARAFLRRARPACALLCNHLKRTDKDMLAYLTESHEAFNTKPSYGFEVSCEQKPEDIHEDVLSSLFVEVLGVEHVDRDDDFFDLGGDSLVATRLVGRIRSRFHLDISVETLFEAPSVAELAARIRKFLEDRATFELKGMGDIKEATDAVLPLNRDATPKEHESPLAANTTEKSRPDRTPHEK
jgi:acyl carrier protein